METPHNDQERGGRERITNRSEEQQGTPETKERWLTPRIWVASLADYNSGRLHGVWLDADEDLDDINEAVERMLASSLDPWAEEYGIFEYGSFGAYELDEFDPLETVVRVAKGITKYGLAFSHWAQLAGAEPESLDRFEEVYEGHFADLAAYGEHIVEAFGFETELDEIQSPIRPYIDIHYRDFARDMEIDGMIRTSEGDGGIYVFQGY